jgi:peroxiredoxin family protein
MTLYLYYIQSDLEEGEGVTLTVDSFHIISELEPGDHKLGQMFKVCREESSELFIMRTIEPQHLYRRIGIQVDVNPDHVIQYITVADEKNDIKRSYFNHLRGSIPFYASLVYILRTEDSDYALIYKMKYNPFMLVNYFHPKIAIPDNNVGSNNSTNNNVNNNNINVNNTSDNMLQIKKKKKISKSISTDNKRKEFDLLFFACEVLVALEDMHNKDMIYG